MAFKERVFSGVQPTGNLHLGNYLGAISEVRRAAGDATTASIASSTCTRSRSVAGAGRGAARSATREVTAAFIACGIDPKKHIVFNQSQVAEHAELAWVFNCVARLGWLNRMTQFKEKAGKDRENASVGLYAYPSADGGRHSGLSRDPCAGRRGPEAASRAVRATSRRSSTTTSPSRSRAHGFGDAFFPLPEPLIQGPATRVMSLRDGTKKMSKSDAVRLFAHQPDRRRRRHRAEDPQGEDRSGAAAERGGGPRDAARRPTIWSASMRRSPTSTQGRGADASSAARSSRPSRRRWSILRSPSSRPIAAEMKRLMQDPAYIDARACRRRRARAGDRRRNHERRQGHRRLRAALTRRPHGVKSGSGARLSPVRSAMAASRYATAGVRRNPGEADEPQAPQLRGRAQAEVPGRHRRIAGVRPRRLLREPARRAHRRERRHAAGDRAARPPSAMARRRRHHAGGGARGGRTRSSTSSRRAPTASPASRPSG